MKSLYKSIKKAGKSAFETKESSTSTAAGKAGKDPTVGPSLPRDLRVWKPNHVDEWLCDIFSGAQSLAK